MNEIEKLYKNAGFSKKQCKDYSCIVCEQYNECIKYPPFTTEKQLLLIQWLAKTRPIHINFYIDKWVIEGMVRYGKRYDTFEDALSGYINQIWQDLTEEEKQQIKEILK